MHELIKNLFMILKVKHVGNIHKRFKQVLKIWILIIDAFLYFYYTFLIRSSVVKRVLSC